MSIPQSFIQQLLMYWNIEEVMSWYVNIKREGRNKKCLCPFHSEKTPSLVIYPDTQSFYCFGCGAGGDVISFIMRQENLEYVEAIRFLAQKAGMELPNEVENNDYTRLRTRIFEINRETARYFHSCLKSKVGAKGLEYLRKRQLENKTIVRYGLGYAPDSWDSLLKHLKSKGFSLEEMESACVVSKSQKNGKTRYYDFFRNRVMFPVIDTKGNIIAFGGRVLDDSKPKYLNTPNTLVFKKTQNLFGLNLAKNTKSNQIILAEGYMDAIAIHEAGFDNVVATLGTALTSEQSRLIASSKNIKELVVAYDSDNAGQIATERAISLLSELSISLKTLNMQGAKDPDEYIKKFGVKRFEMLLKNAANSIEFRLKKAEESVDMQTADGKIEYIKKAVSVLSEVPNVLTREVYVVDITEKTGVAKDRILKQIESFRKNKKRREEKREWDAIKTNKTVMQDRVNPQKAKNLKQALAEEKIITFLFRNQDYYDKILDKIKPEDFVTDFGRKVFEAIIDCRKSCGEIMLGSMVSDLSQEEVNRISQILASNDEESFNVQMIYDCIQVILDYKNLVKVKDIKTMTIDELREYTDMIKEAKLKQIEVEQ